MNIKIHTARNPDNTLSNFLSCNGRDVAFLFSGKIFAANITSNKSYSENDLIAKLLQLGVPGAQAIASVRQFTA